MILMAIHFLNQELRFLFTPFDTWNVFELGRSALNQEAIRLVKQMPKWKPGINNGKEVNVKMVIPIIISLN